MCERVNESVTHWFKVAVLLAGSAQDDFLRAHRNSRDCEARGDGVFPDPQNCRFYYNCRNGVLSYSFRCPDGFVFHPTDRRCIASDNCVEKTFKPLIFAAGAQQDSQPISVTSELSDKRPAQLDKLALTDNLRPNNTVFIGGGRNSTGSPAIDGLVNIEALADSQANLISTQEVKILSNYTTQHFYRTTTTTVPSLQLGGHTAAQTYLLKVVFNRRQNDQFRTAFDTDTSGATNPFEADLNPLPRFQPSATVSSSPVVVNNVDSSTSEPQVAVTTSPLSTASSHTHFYNTNMTALVMNVSQSHQNITNNGSITVAAEFVMASNTSKISFSNSSINENITGIGNSSQFEFITYDSNSTEVNGNISSFAVTDSLRLFNNQSGINSTTNETDTNPTVYKNDTITEALSLTTTTANINDLNSRNRVQLSEDSIRSSSSSTDSNPSANITSNGHSAANQSNHTNPHTAVEAEANGNVTNNTYTVLFPPVSPRHEMLNETIKAIISSNEGQLFDVG